MEGDHYFHSPRRIVYIRKAKFDPGAFKVWPDLLTSFLPDEDSSWLLEAAAALSWKAPAAAAAASVACAAAAAAVRFRLSAEDISSLYKVIIILSAPGTGRN